MSLGRLGWAARLRQACCHRPASGAGRRQLLAWACALGLTGGGGFMPSAWATDAAPAPAATRPEVRPQVVAYQVEGDGIAQPLDGAIGDAGRGRSLVVNRQQGLCLLCHSGPFPEERFQGNLAPSLAGAGSRWSTAQLRLRLVDSRRLNPQSIMPAYHRTEGLQHVARAWQDKPLFSAQQVEDVVAFLATLKE